MKTTNATRTWKDELESWRIASDQGYAFIDGVFVQTDTFADPRPDRVFPILREEQPCMWFLVRREIKRLRKVKNSKSITVLDVGTGSGLFALLCAKEGCDVVAIDISPRAIELAKRNWKTNNDGAEIEHTILPRGRHEYSLTDVLHRKDGKGSIHLVQGNMEWLALGMTENEEKIQGFDLVLLTPPYNPTHPDLEKVVAKHAEAGGIGQDIFDLQVEYLHKNRWLSQNGTCVINHNSCYNIPYGDGVVGREFQENIDSHRLHAVHKIKHELTKPLGPLEIEVFPGLSKEIPAADFLNQQYVDIADSLNAFRGYANQVVDKSGGAFTYIFAVVRAGVPSKSKVKVSLKQLSDQQGQSPEEFHSRGWPDRIRAHRLVVSSTPVANTESLRTLLRNTTARPLSSFLSPAAYCRTLVPKRIIESDTEEDSIALQLLPELNRYIEKERLLDHFSEILINASPMHGGNRQTITHQVGVWGGERYTQNSLQNMSQSQHIDSRVAPWLKLVSALSDSQMAPFTHPAFCGSLSVFKDRRPWWPLVFISDSRNGSRSHINCPQFSKYLCSFREAFLRIQNHPIDSEGAKFNESNATFAFWGQTLKDIGRYDFKKAKMAAMDRCRENHINSLTDDLLLIHHLIHQVLSESDHTCKHEKESLYTRQESWFIGIPLGFIFQNPDTLAVDGPPSHYKGAIWVYAKAYSGDDELRGPALWNFVRLAWLLVTGIFDPEWEQAEIKKAERGGEVQQLQRWMGMLGHELIKDWRAAAPLLKPDYFQTCDPREQKMICTYCSQLFASGEAWTLTGKDSSEREILAPSDLCSVSLQSAIEHYCQIVWRNFSASRAVREFQVRNMTFDRRLKQFEAFDECPFTITSDWIGTTSWWDEAFSGRKGNLNLPRIAEYISLIIAAAVKNAFKHSYEKPQQRIPSEPVRVHLSIPDTADCMTLTIQNTHHTPSKKKRFNEALKQLHEDKCSVGSFATMSLLVRELCFSAGLEYEPSKIFTGQSDDDICSFGVSFYIPRFRQEDMS